MKLVYDNIIFGSQKIGGISIVWYELLKRALRDNHDLSFIEFSPVDNIMRPLLDIPKDLIRTIPIRYRKLFKYLPVSYKASFPFIFHSSFFRYCLSKNAINVTTVHDFTNEYFQRGSGARKERWIKHNAIRHSDYIVCISENTRKDFFKFYPNFPSEKVKVIYNGVSDDYYQIKEGGDEWNYKFDKKKYVMFVGNRDGYKNFKIVVEALSEYNIDLVIAGCPLSNYETEMLSSIKGSYYHIGRVTSETLNLLYNNAYSLIYPSSYEGFGLPIIEAQKAACPVIALNESSIPEIIGDTPLVMQSVDKHEIVAKLKILEDDSIRNQVISSGLENSKRFSWDKMYIELINFYKKALAEV